MSPFAAEVVVEERRKFQRVAFDAPARLGDATELSEGRIIDLSFKGALLRTSAASSFHLGQRLELRVSLVAVEVTMSVEVVRIGQAEVGLKCHTIDLESMIHLRRLIELNLEDPGLLDREFLALVS